MARLVFILGSSNAADGSLSSISLARVETAIAAQKRDVDRVLLATGGFGLHFNTSKTPHRELVYRYSAVRGAVFDRAQPTDLLSSNTVEDLVLIGDFARTLGLVSYDIVTTSFHTPRCHFILNCLALDHAVNVIQANDPADLGRDIVDHEARALAQLNAQGGVLVGGLFYPHR